MKHLPELITSLPLFDFVPQVPENQTTNVTFIQIEDRSFERFDPIFENIQPYIGITNAS